MNSTWSKDLIRYNQNVDPVLIYKMDDQKVISFYKLNSFWSDMTGFSYCAFVRQSKGSVYGHTIYSSDLKELIWDCFEVLTYFKYEIDRDFFNLYFNSGDESVEE
jgi:hypothetical protein